MCACPLKFQNLETSKQQQKMSTKTDNGISFHRRLNHKSKIKTKSKHIIQSIFLRYIDWYNRKCHRLNFRFSIYCYVYFLVWKKDLIYPLSTPKHQKVNFTKFRQMTFKKQNDEIWCLRMAYSAEFENTLIA